MLGFNVSLTLFQSYCDGIMNNIQLKLAYIDINSTKNLLLSADMK